MTQKAGHIDAIIEDEIRRCRFLIADLSDGQCGSLLAGWNRGRSRQTGDLYLSGGYENTLDTDHRQTVRWDLNALDDTAKTLKAVIRNTLLGDAKQQDG